jgi:hypothetical protein
MQLQVQRKGLSFEKQINDLLQQLQPSTNDNNADYISNAFSNDNFAFGEMLNYAAQWPDFQDTTNFSDIGNDLATTTGNYIY